MIGVGNKCTMLWVIVTIRNWVYIVTASPSMYTNLHPFKVSRCLWWWAYRQSSCVRWSIGQSRSTPRNPIFCRLPRFVRNSSIFDSIKHVPWTRVVSEYFLFQFGTALIGYALCSCGYPDHAVAIEKSIGFCICVLLLKISGYFSNQTVMQDSDASFFSASVI